MYDTIPVKTKRNDDVVITMDGYDKSNYKWDPQLKKTVYVGKKKTGKQMKANEKNENTLKEITKLDLLASNQNKIPISLTTLTPNFTEKLREEKFSNLPNTSKENQVKALVSVIQHCKSDAEDIAKKLNESGLGFTNWTGMKTDSGFLLKATDGNGNERKLRITLPKKK